METDTSSLDDVKSILTSTKWC